MAEGTQAGSSNLPPSGPPANHGKTPAAWTTLLLVTLGSIACAVGFVVESWPLAIAGGAVAVLAVVVGKVMQAMGFGQPRGAVTTTSTPRG